MSSAVGSPPGITAIDTHGSGRRPRDHTIHRKHRVDPAARKPLALSKGPAVPEDDFEEVAAHQEVEGARNGDQLLVDGWRPLSALEAGRLLSQFLCPSILARHDSTMRGIDSNQVAPGLNVDVVMIGRWVVGNCSPMVTQRDPPFARAGAWVHCDQPEGLLVGKRGPWVGDPCD